MKNYCNLLLAIAFTVCLPLLTTAQDSITIKKRIVGTFHTPNSQINGISVGAYSTSESMRNVTTNGLRLEVPGVGLLYFMVPKSLISETPFSLKEYTFSEVISGVNISGGIIGNVKNNGITIAGVGQFLKAQNGLAIALFMNEVDQQNGLQLAIACNNTYYMKGVQLAFGANSSEKGSGVQAAAITNGSGNFKGAQIAIGANIGKFGRGIQIGLFNKSEDFKGLQLGLWNVNQKRKLPFVNWNFR